MAAIIKQYDKRSGNTYVYESISWWDKEKKYSRSKRKLIGKIDKDTGEAVATDGRNHKARGNNGAKIRRIDVFDESNLHSARVD